MTIKEANSVLFARNKKLEKQIELLRLTLSQCRTKLEVYRDHSDGAYHGGIEHCALIGNIDRTLLLTGKEK